MNMVTQVVDQSWDRELVSIHARQHLFAIGELWRPRIVTGI